MGDYNPRQITQMRWKDAKELEKYLFLTGEFNFETKLLTHVSNDKLYKRIYEELALCAKNQTRKGIIIEDTGFGGCYIGEIADDNTLQIVQLASNPSKIVAINIANDDELQITVTEENNAPKMYRHDLIITSMEDLQIYHTIYATNNTPITNDQIFATVVKANGDYGGQGMYLDSNVNIQNALIRYSGGKVVVQTNAGGLVPAKSITDTVTPV